MTEALIFGTIKSNQKAILYVARSLLNDVFSIGGVFMPGYSYFNYDQMPLLEVEVHSDELALLKNTVEIFVALRQKRC